MVEGEASVVGGLTTFDIEVLLQKPHQLVRTTQITRKIRAHLDVELSNGLLAEHRVEGSGVHHLRSM